LQLLASEVGALEEQLETRKILDRAKGVLIDRFGLSESDAYSFIQRSAMSERARMRDVAEQVISGTLEP
jgi:response regulator NasT